MTLELLEYPSSHRVAAAVLIALVFGLAVVAAPRRPGARVTLLLAGLGAVTLLWAPTVFTHRLRWVEPARLEWTEGYWWAPRARAVDLERVRCIAERRELSGRGTVRVWYLQRLDGESERVVFGDLLEAHEPRLRALAERAGVGCCSALDRGR